MSWYQGNDLRKPSGGLKRRHRDKRKHELGRPPTLTKVSSVEEREGIRVRGGNYKVRVTASAYVNTYIPNENVVKKLRILEVVDNPANIEYKRSGILTKGAIVRTEIGLVKITSRPGQDGVVNGVLVEKTR
uniref:Small ribosomal subunit protein eS8 n=1 Tax=Staphylothermus marinus TaxID=2280 RepID=A0A7C4D6D3_STAMA